MRGNEDVFGRHLDVLHALSRRFAGEMRMTTTLFNSWSTLRRLTAPDSDVHGPPSRGRIADGRDATMSKFLAEAPQALARASIRSPNRLPISPGNALPPAPMASTFPSATTRCHTAESFLALRSGGGGAGVYDRLVRDGDLKILSAASAGTLNILHVCGTPLDFHRFGGYPVHAVNWADRIGGPPIAEVASWLRPAICCGIDNLGTLVSGTPDAVEHEVIDAVEQAADRPIIVAPGCTFDGRAAPAENLHAIRRAVDRLAQSVARP